MIPRAKKTAFGGLRGDVAIIRLAAPPVDGAANDALIEFLSESLGLPRRAVQITSGEHSRHKRVAIAGVSAAGVRALLQV